MTSNYIGTPFVPWWDEAATGPAPYCGRCGAMMVRNIEAMLLIWGPGPIIGKREENTGWECLSCGKFTADKEQTDGN